MISEDEEREEDADVLGMDSLNAGREKGIVTGSSETGAAAVVETGTGKMGGSTRSKLLGLVVSDLDSDSLFAVAVVVVVPRAGLLSGLSGITPPGHEYGYGYGSGGVDDGDGEIETGAD